MIDIVIAARNEERDLGDCLKSLHPYGAKILVAVDATSRDRTAQITREYGATVVAGGRGAAACRNLAWRLGDSELVAFLDAHCVAQPGWLEALLKKLRDTGAGGVQGHIDYLFTGPTARESAAQSAYAWLKSGNCLYRREVLERVEGFDESLPGCEDVDLSWRALHAGFPLAFAAGAKVTHLDRGTSGQHLRRSLLQGMAAGMLARRFALEAPPFPGWGANARRWAYWIGAKLGEVRGSQTHISQATYAWVDWTESQKLRPASGVMWWHEENQVVLVEAQRRVGLSGGGELFWRCLFRSWSRKKLIQALPRAEQDLDSWVQAMLADGWLEAQSGV